MNHISKEKTDETRRASRSARIAVAAATPIRTSPTSPQGNMGPKASTDNRRGYTGKFNTEAPRTQLHLGRKATRAQNAKKMKANALKPKEPAVYDADRGREAGRRGQISYSHELVDGVKTQVYQGVDQPVPSIDPEILRDSNAKFMEEGIPSKITVDAAHRTARKRAKANVDPKVLASRDPNYEPTDEEKKEWKKKVDQSTAAIKKPASKVKPR